MSIGVGSWGDDNGGRWQKVVNPARLQSFGVNTKESFSLSLSLSLSSPYMTVQRQSMDRRISLQPLLALLLDLMTAGEIDMEIPPALPC